MTLTRPLAMSTLEFPIRTHVYRVEDLAKGDFTFDLDPSVSVMYPDRMIWTSCICAVVKDARMVLDIKLAVAFFYGGLGTIVTL